MGLLHPFAHSPDILAGQYAKPSDFLRRAAQSQGDGVGVFQGAPGLDAGNIEVQRYPMGIFLGDAAVTFGEVGKEGVFFCRDSRNAFTASIT